MARKKKTSHTETESTETQAQQDTLEQESTAALSADTSDSAEPTEAKLLESGAVHDEIAPNEALEQLQTEALESYAPDAVPAAEDVALIQDPFGIRTFEISEAQQSTEELEELNEDFSDMEESEADEETLEVAEAQAETHEEAEDSESEETLEASSEAETESDSDFSAEDLEDLDDGADEFDVIDPAAIRAQLSGLADAIAKAEQEDTQRAEDLAAAAEQVEADAKAQLEREIAEDEALQRQMAEEAENADKVDPEVLAALPNALDLAEMQSAIEALLFISDKPLSLKKLHELLGEEDYQFSTMQEALTALKDRYQKAEFGIELVEVGNALQFRTKPGRAALARKLAKVQVQRLSAGAMESLAIVAYKQPVLKDEVDKIRGVDSSYFIRQLLDRKLIKISGRSELPGKPMLYSTTQEFLELFGLKDLNAMPSLQEIEQMVPASQTKNPGDEDPRVVQMRKLVGEMNADTSVSLIYNPREDEQILQDIRERVGSIPTSTPYLDEQKAAEKAAKEAAIAAAKAAQEPAANLDEELARAQALESLGQEEPVVASGGEDAGEISVTAEMLNESSEAAESSTSAD